MMSPAELRAAADRLEELGAPLISYLTLRSIAAERDGLPTGDCFQRVGVLAIEVLQRRGRWAGLPMQVCHGEVTHSFGGERIPHAWVEVPGEATVTDDDGTNERTTPMQVVIDNTQPDPKSRILPAPIFYEKTSAQVLRRMDVAEYIGLVRSYGNDGPWP